MVFNQYIIKISKWYVEYISISKFSTEINFSLDQKFSRSASCLKYSQSPNNINIKILLSKLIVRNITIFTKF